MFEVQVDYVMSLASLASLIPRLVHAAQRAHAPYLGPAFSADGTRQQPLCARPGVGPWCAIAVTGRRRAAAHLAGAAHARPRGQPCVSVDDARRHAVFGRPYPQRQHHRHRSARVIPLRMNFCGFFFSLFFSFLSRHRVVFHSNDQDHYRRRLAFLPRRFLCLIDGALVSLPSTFSPAL